MDYIHDTIIVSSLDTLESIMKGYTLIYLINANKLPKGLQSGSLVELSNPNRTLVVVKTISSIKHINSLNDVFSHLPLLKYGYTPFSLNAASPDDLLERNGISPDKPYSLLAIEFEEKPLQRYIIGQAGILPECSSYEEALNEIKTGRKESHWIWYIWPQIKGLTNDPVTEYYGLCDYKEAISFIHHPLLGQRLDEITNVILNHNTNDPVSILGMVDSFKLRASMTLFEAINPGLSVFSRVLDKFCMGVRDKSTLALL